MGQNILKLSKKSLMISFIIAGLLSQTFAIPPVSAKSLTQESRAAVLSGSLGGCSMFPANNIWNTPVDNLPIHARSDQWVNSIGRSTGFHMDFGSGTWNGGPIGIPYNIVGSSTSKVAVSFYYPDESDPGPYPIPTNPLREYGSDHHILIVDNSTCTLYELYDASYSGGRWNAGSGAIWSLNSNALRPDTWTSADAAGLPILPGLVRYDEILAGQINHAIRFTAQNTNGYIWPARHLTSNNPGAPQIPPMGARFRLKASYNISGYPPEMQVILRAMKTYGIILADNGSNWYVSGAPDARWNNTMLHLLDALTGNDFEAVDSSSLMVDYNSGATGLTISGNVGVAGATLSYTDGVARTATSLTDGSYSLQVSNGWSGSVTPSHACYTFRPISLSYTNVTSNQVGQDFAPTFNPASSCADVTVTIGNTNPGNYTVPPETAITPYYSGMAGGPVVVKSNNGAPIIASMLELRRSNITVNQWTGIAQVMGMQLENLSDKYVFPRYTNIDASKYEVIPIANYETFDTHVTVKVGSSNYGPFLVAAGTSYTFNKAIEGGPVIVSSDNGARIVASLYQLKRAGTTGRWNGQSEMMGIPQIKLSDTYVLPNYDYTTPGLLPSLNIANTDSIATDITVSIGTGYSITYPSVAAGTSQVVSYQGVAGGPVVVKSSNGAKIIASMLELRRSNLTVNQWTGIAQVIGMQLENLSDKYVFPRYTNIDVTKYEVIPIANYETFDTNVTIKVGSTDYGPYLVSAGTSYTFNQAIEGGPVIISSDNGARIIASLYQLKRAGTTGRWNGQSEMMGIPFTQLSSSYVLPYYDYTTPGLQPSLNIAVP